ncbi:aldehyde dehydrogenase [Aureococcus anophagefferens]|nr:aldehyde dehydrogenase [Aureococcus anophagefferens]
MRSHFRSLQRAARRAPHRAARPTTQQTSRGFSAASLWIDGAPCGASDGAWLDVRSPRDDGVFGALSDASADDAARAVGAAQRVHDAGAWAADAARAAALRFCASGLRDDLEAYAQIEAADCGKVLAEARGDIGYCADVLDYYARLLEERRTSAAAVLKVAPAVAAGCPLVLKPSPLASLTCVKFFAELLGPCAPRGAVNLLTGGPPSTPASRATEALTRDPRVALASFTGSGTGGRAVLEASAANLRPTSLELGGKGALLVLDDADVDAAADFAALGILQCSGQVCSATSRLLVHESLEEALLEKLLAKVDAVVVGDPLDEASTMGPVVSEAQRAKIEDAVAASLSTGGAELVSKPVDVDERGYYVAPAVLRNPRDDAPAWTEEIFGPVLCVRPFRDDAEAVAAANASPYGLAHAVFTADRRRGDAAAAGLDAGVVWVNNNQLLWPATPFGAAERPAGRAARRGSGRQQRKTVISAPHGGMGCYPGRGVPRQLRSNVAVARRARY